MKTIRDLEKNYEVDFEKIINEIKKQKAKLVLLQFADGLKPYATSVVNFLEKETNAEFLIWLGDCFGACDTPVLPSEIKVDLVVQIGHSAYAPTYASDETLPRNWKIS